MLWQFVPDGSPACCSICLDPWASWIIFKTIERCWRPVVIKFGGEPRNCPDQCFGSERFRQTTTSSGRSWWRFSYQKKDRWRPFLQDRCNIAGFVFEQAYSMFVHIARRSLQKCALLSWKQRCSECQRQDWKRNLAHIIVNPDLKDHILCLFGVGWTVGCCNRILN